MPGTRAEPDALGAEGSASARSPRQLWMRPLDWGVSSRWDRGTIPPTDDRSVPPTEGGLLRPRRGIDMGGVRRWFIPACLAVAGPVLLASSCARSGPRSPRSSPPQAAATPLPPPLLL